jgi:hypothetical protein
MGYNFTANQVKILSRAKSIKNMDNDREDAIELQRPAGSFSAQLYLLLSCDICNRVSFSSIQSTRFQGPPTPNPKYPRQNPGETESRRT